MLMDMMLPIDPSIVLSEMVRGSGKLIILLRCLAANGTGISAGYGPPVYKEEPAAPDAKVFYLLDQTFNAASQKIKKGLDPQDEE